MNGKSSATGLFFGSFNPIHCGHLMIANYMLEYAGLNQVWFIVSPRNPLKEKSSLLAGHHRLAMTNIAVEDDPRMKASNIEFHLPEPSYTIDTLTYLHEKYPDREFVMIAGQDCLTTLHKWKNYEQLLELYEICLYPRPGVSPTPFDHHPHVRFTNSPLIEISSSFIRNAIREKKDLRHFLPPKVWEYVREMHFYE